MVANFIEAIHSQLGYGPSEAELRPGKVIRFATSDKRDDLNGWCILFEDLEGGAFGCWRQGVESTWQARQPRTDEEKAAFKEKVAKAKDEAARHEAEVRAECCRKSAELWDKASPQIAHAYLETKQVKAHGLRQLGDSLLVPVRDSGGNLRGLQFIGLDGSKKFKSGTALKSCYHSMGKPGGKLLVAEGYATAATLHEATGLAVACAFNAGNLKPVAKALRSKLPDATLIICADDDSATEGNPGLTKATEAARTVGGLLAVPLFPENRGPKDTDFNDLARLAGPEAVKSCIDRAAGLNEGDEPQSLEAAIARLAAMPPLEYDRIRKDAAKALGVRPSTLDKAVKDARSGEDDDSLPFVEVDPWPEPIDPAALLSDIASTIRRFIVCNPEVADAVALWVAMTWFIDVVQVAPLAVITAPEKRCGKSQLLGLLGRLSAKAITASSISPAALFRTIDAWKPTILIDEADAFMKDNEELRGLLNSGHTRDSAYVIRTVGDSFTPTKFNTWGAKALAGIGHVADTLMDRAVILELRRKLAGEEVERIRYAEPGLFDDLQAKLARFADDYREKVRLARPPLPNELNDRAQDNWEPLLAIAMVASDEWLSIGTAAALKLSGSDSAAQTLGTELLSDIHEIFAEKGIDRISSADLISALCADDEKPWATYNRGQQIKPRQLAKKLKEYGITSKTIRVGVTATPKGYERDQFDDAFLRYVATPEIIRNTATMAPRADLDVAFANSYPQQHEIIRHTQQTTTAPDDAHSVADNPQRCVNEFLSATPKAAPRANVAVLRIETGDDEQKYLKTEEPIRSGGHVVF